MTDTNTQLKQKLTVYYPEFMDTELALATNNLKDFFHILLHVVLEDNCHDLENRKEDELNSQQNI